MADIQVGNTKVFTIPANAETKLVFPSFIQNFSINSLSLSNDIYFRYDNVDAVVGNADNLVMNSSIAGYVGLYRKTQIPYISIITATESEIILYNLH